MAETRLVKLEEAYYNFDDEVAFENLENDVVIDGNNHFEEKGDSTLLDIVRGDYYDDSVDDDGDEIVYDYDTLPELEKYTGKTWTEGVIKGYDQGDWQNIYYSEDVAPETVKLIQDFYFGMITCFKDIDEGIEYFVPDRIAWKGKNAICDYLGLNPDETEIVEDEE